MEDKKLPKDQNFNTTDQNLIKPSDSSDKTLTSTKRNYKLVYFYVFPTLLILGVILGILFWPNKTSAPANNTQQANNQASDNSAKEETTAQKEVDLTKLPLGDGKYSSQPKQGYVYSCQTSYNGGGAFKQGPWIDSKNKTWDLTSKISVDGNVSWATATWLANISQQKRMISSKDLPKGHTTGTFPVSSSDDAYNYDRNPNQIKAQTISFEVPANPTVKSTPGCIGGEVGIATTGVLIFNAFDAGGRDAVATEIQDHCEGHPQAGSYYHYHGYSSCFDDDSGDDEHSDLLGYSFDGFGIFGLKGENGAELTSADLDECHGHTHNINWDGKETKMYHYHMTHDFPYTVACFRGEASVKALSSNGSGIGPGNGPQQGQLPPPRP